MNTTFSLLRLKIILFLASYLFFTNLSLAQKSSSALGSWDYTFNTQESEMALEGTLTIVEKNGHLTGIIKFKRGAFEAENAVKPVFMKFDWSYCSPAYTLGFIPLMVL